VCGGVASAEGAHDLKVACMVKFNGRWEPSHINNVVFPEEEIKRAARTLVGKPVRVNFEGDAVGYVVDAEYVPGGIEYTIEVPNLKAAYVVQHMKGNEVYGAVFTELSLTKAHGLKEEIENE